MEIGLKWFDLRCKSTRLMFHFRQATIKINGKTQEITPNRHFSNELFYVDFKWNDGADLTRRCQIYVHPKSALTLQRIELQLSTNEWRGKFLANGFQSWSESRALGPNEGVLPLRKWARPYMGLYGDEYIPGIVRATGYAHSWTYAEWIGDDGVHHLAASNNEDTGFTMFQFDHERGLVTITKDLPPDGLALTHSFPLFDLIMASGSRQEVYGYWRDGFCRPPRVSAKAGGTVLGWTSWYRHFTHIDQDIILKNAENAASSGLPFEYFQIDDGWQTAVGDWRTTQPGFSMGMGALARQIAHKGLKPGLWLAPFVASAQSTPVRNHPDWLLRRDGKPLRAGYNPMWGGWYYALDIYHPGVRDYLSGVFHVVVDHWGYQLLKLDFLFAACLAPPEGKTRGQVMHDAMQWLRTLCKDRVMLACGAPLGAAMGYADICRIGGDIHTEWRHRLLRFLRHRERVDTESSLISTIHRRPLDGLFWQNDPDVFIMRSDHQRLTPTQRHTVLTINALLGSVLFTSDDPGLYDTEQKEEILTAIDLSSAAVRKVVEMQSGVFAIDVDMAGTALTFVANLRGLSVNIDVKGRQIVCAAYETVMLA